MKKIIFLSLVMFTYFYAIESNMSLSKNKEYNYNDCKNELSLGGTCEDSLRSEGDINRITNTLECFYLFESYTENKALNNQIKQFSSTFFGLCINENIFFQPLQKQLFLNSIVAAVTEFNAVASSDLKYLCDMQINVILSFKTAVLEKIKKKDIYSIISLAYYYYLFFPNEYINVINNNEYTDDKINDIELEANWQEASFNIILECAELGVLNNGFLYDLFDIHLMQKLSSKKKFQYVKLTQKILPEAIIEKENIFEKINTTYQAYKLSFQHNEKCYLRYKNREDLFIVWLMDRQNISTTVEKMCNDDNLFLLFIVVLLHKSILKINLTDYYPNIDHGLQQQLSIAATQGEFILTQLCKLFLPSEAINWNSLPIVIINEDRLMRMIQALSTITIL